MRMINIIGEIDANTIKEVLNEIFKIENADNEILESNSKLANRDDHQQLEDLYVNIISLGGSVYGATAIYDALKNLKCKVITRGFGTCCSSALFILLAGNERYAGKNTEFLIHSLSYDMNYVKLADHIDLAKHHKKLQEKMDKVILDETEITKEMLKDKEREDWLLFFDEALELKIIDGEIK